jgi:signal transduction histidine kinase
MLTWDSSTAADLLRARTGAIASAWEDATRSDALEVSRLAAHEIREPLDGLVDALADFLDGPPDRAATLWTVVDAHVLHRLRHGLALGVVVLEYARLRLCLHTALAEMAPLTAVDRAIDLTVAHAAQRYHEERELTRDRYVGMLAHDLRTPLSCIVMASEMLLAGQHAPHHRPLLDQVFDSAARMQRMVTDVLTFARTQHADSIPIDPRDADLGDVVREVADEMQTIYGDHAVAAEITGDLRGAFDRDRVYQLVANLVRNAIEHGNGSVVVRACEASDALVLVVHNCGAMHATDATDSGPRKRSTNTRGLGLYIVDQIARAHGAHVELSSSPDETTVTVRWPKPSRSDRPEPPVLVAEGT